VPGAAGYVHPRYAGLGANGQPGAVQALEEVLRLSREAKAPLHVSHVTSSGLSATATLLKMIADAKAQGQDVTAELYPYTAAMSGINSTWFAAGWQRTLAISYDKLQWPKTGEFLTDATFKKYQRDNPGDEVIIPRSRRRRSSPRSKIRTRRSSATAWCFRTSSRIPAARGRRRACGGRSCASRNC
jgi:hypothetical protein